MNNRTRRALRRRRERLENSRWTLTPKGVRYLELLEQGLSEEEAEQIVNEEFPEDES